MISLTLQIWSTEKVPFILSNKPSSFQLSHATEAGLSDYHKQLFPVQNLRSENYRNYKKLDERNFLSAIQQDQFECKSCDVNKTYENFVQKLLKIVNNHAPLKSKTVRGKNVSFMNKDWRKAIFKRTRLKNIFNRKRFRDN